MELTEKDISTLRRSFRKYSKITFEKFIASGYSTAIALEIMSILSQEINDFVPAGYHPNKKEVS